VSIVRVCVYMCVRVCVLVCVCVCVCVCVRMSVYAHVCVCVHISLWHRGPAFALLSGADAPMGVTDNPEYVPEADLDDDHSALDSFPVILLAAGYKGVGLRNDSPMLTELGRLSFCLRVQTPQAHSNWADEEASARRMVLGRDGRPVSSQVAGIHRERYVAGDPFRVLMRAHVCVCVWSVVLVGVYVHACVYVYACVCTPVCVRLCVCVCVCACVWVGGYWPGRILRMEQRARFAQEKKTALLLRQGQRLVRHKLAVLFGYDEAVVPSGDIVNPLFRGTRPTHACTHKKT
jgi:hypothetical protein